MKKFIMAMLLMLLFLPGGVWAAQTQEGGGPPEQKGHMKPPPEAFAVCKGKSEGDAVQFTTPRGDTLKGVCRQFEGVLAAMPERGTPPSKGSKPDENNSGHPEN